MKAKEERRRTELKSQMTSELAAEAWEFGRLSRFLAEEQAVLECCLPEVQEAQLGGTRAAAGHQWGLRLLQDIKETFNRCEEVQLQPPEICLLTRVNLIATTF